LEASPGSSSERVPVATEDDLASFREPPTYRVGAVEQDVAIAAVDEDGEAPRGLSGADVSPAVPDHVASAEVDAALVRGGDQHTRLRLVAARRRGVDLPAHPHVVEGQCRTESIVHG